MARLRKLTLKVTDEEYELTKSEAEKVGMNMSAFIRLLIRQWGNGIRFERREIKEEASAKG